MALVTYYCWAADLLLGDPLQSWQASIMVDRRRVRV